MISAAPEPESLCPVCETPIPRSLASCGHCGYILPEAGACGTDPLDWAVGTTVRDRYRIEEWLGRRGRLSSYAALDQATHRAVVIRVARRDDSASTQDSAIILAAEPAEPANPRGWDLAGTGSGAAPAGPGLQPLAAHGPSPAVPVPYAEPAGDTEVIGPPPEVSHRAAPSVLAVDEPCDAAGLDLHHEILRRAAHRAVPRVIERFDNGPLACLVEERLAGRPIMAAWHHPETTQTQRVDWLIDLVNLIRHFAAAGILMAHLRPGRIAIGPDGRPILTDVLGAWLLPIPEEARLEATPYVAPELILRPATANVRADVYSFGAVLYALLLNRELTDDDFSRLGEPLPYTQHDPRVHPLLARIVSKTFVRDAFLRFPSRDEPRAAGPSGLDELEAALIQYRDALVMPRLDIACLTNIGKVRAGNEDSFSVTHRAGANRDRVDDLAVIVIADGMGGAEAGEWASGMAVQSMGRRLERSVFGPAAPELGMVDAPVGVPDLEQLMADAIAEANDTVYQAALVRPERMGMGCALEAAIIQRGRVTVGHVGDCRCYHWRAGFLNQVSRDQTFVAQLVELGRLTAEQAAHHPRQGELMEAVGPTPHVTSLTYSFDIEAGDMLVLCSDGLTSHVPAAMINDVLAQDPPHAESAARRLINLANEFGGTDNITVAVIRCS